MIFGGIDIMHPYIKFNGYGNLETLGYNDIDDLASDNNLFGSYIETYL